MKTALSLILLCTVGMTMSSSVTSCPRGEDQQTNAFHDCNAPVIAARNVNELCQAMTSAIDCVLQLALYCPSFMEAMGISELQGLQDLAQNYCKF